MKQKTVLITGAAGFIGSHLTEKCASLGVRVKAFFHYNSRNHHGWLEQSPHLKKINFVSGDIRDFDSVSRAVKGCDEVYHLAALIGIPYSYESPLAYIKTNVEGTYNILEASRLHGVKNIVVTSTSETYGSAQYTPIDEKHPAVGQSPYAATKIAADELALSYHKSFGLPVKVARPFNAYGPRQSARAIIPSIILQVLGNKKKIQLGNLHTTRDLTFVTDTVNGFLDIARSPKLVGQATNIGMNQEISIQELAERIFRLMNSKTKILKDRSRIRPEKSEVQRLRCDNSKLKAHTGWQPRANLDDGLRQTIGWFKKNASLYKSDIYNV